MANKNVDEKIDALAVGRGFEDVLERMDAGFKRVSEDFRNVQERLEGIEDRLERVETKVTGLAARVEVLEDVMRMVRTKLSL